MRILDFISKNKVLQYATIIVVVFLLLMSTKSYFPTDDILSYIESSTTKQLKSILQQTERERDEYKTKVRELDKQFGEAAIQRDLLAKEKIKLYVKLQGLEKELQILAQTIIITPSEDKNELVKQFKDLGFDAKLMRCEP